MLNWTLLEIKDKVTRDLDLETEDFIQPDELTAIINEGVDECEAEIHTLGREADYFMKRTTINLVQGTQRYSLPTDIYANKIRHIIYKKGTTIYPVQRVRGLDKFERVKIIEHYNNSTDYYQYMLMNDDAATGYEIELYPSAQESGAFLDMWYVRNANRLSADTDICDIPEFVYYVIDFAKFEILKKEGNPNAIEQEKKVDRQRQRMVETLTNMVPDEDNTIPKDMQHYLDQS